MVRIPTAFLFLAAFLLSASESRAEQSQLSPGHLLGESGLPRTFGWSPTEQAVFNPQSLQAPAARLRQWDFFTVANERFAVNITLADIGFARFCMVDLIEFATKKSAAAFTFPLHATDVLRLSKTTRDHTVCKMGGHTITFESLSDRRIVTIDMPGGIFSDEIRGRLVLHQPPDREFLSLAMPFNEDQGAFFYENKIPAMPAEGRIETRHRTYAFAVTDSFAILDWGRGVWPKEVTWYWGGAAGYVDGVPLGLNLGFGFGNTSHATENLLVYDGKAHKLGEIEWTFDREDWMAPWRFTSADGAFNLKFTPNHVQHVGANLWFKGMRLDKVYGVFSGTVTLADGTLITVDRLFGFAEEMWIRW